MNLPENQLEITQARHLMHMNSRDADCMRRDQEVDALPCLPMHPDMANAAASALFALNADRLLPAAHPLKRQAQKLSGGLLLIWNKYIKRARA